MTDDELKQDLSKCHQTWSPNPDRFDSWLKQGRKRKSLSQFRHRTIAACCGLSIAVFAFILSGPKQNDTTVDPLYVDLANMMLDAEPYDDQDEMEFIDDVFDTL